MASVVLPTTRWTAECDDVLAGLRPDDRLVVACDASEDPVVKDAPDRAEVVVAGQPEGCAGKANALAAAMERTDDRIVVWTDDDVARDAGWRDRLVDRAREHGAATEVPVYVGRGLWRLLEPAFLVLGSLGVAHGGHVWGGGVAFDRTELDETRLLADLRRTVGDDSLLSQRVPEPWADVAHPRAVRVGGDLRSIYHRIARFVKGAAYFEPGSTAGLAVLVLAFAAAAIGWPLATGSVLPALGLAAVSTFGTVAGYLHLDVTPWSAALAFPSLLVLPVVFGVGLAAPAFRWGSRRYRWTGRFDVTVLTDDGDREGRGTAPGKRGADDADPDGRWTDRDVERGDR